MATSLLFILVLHLFVGCLCFHHHRSTGTLWRSKGSALHRSFQSQLGMAKKDAISRRKKRRRQISEQKDVVKDEEKTAETAESKDTTTESVGFVATDGAIGDDGIANLEEMFGLGAEQLRELEDTELPVPREDLVTGKEVVQEDKDKVFKLPDLAEYMEETGGKSIRDKDKRGMGIEEAAIAESDKIDRSDMEEYRRVLKFNPFADADDEMFAEQYDIFQAIFGTGKLLGVPIPFLQSGHTILVLITLLSAFVYFPGNPLTEFPLEVRQFLQQSLLVVYSINTVLAIQAFFKAKEKNLPGLFWFAKTWLLGGIAFYEISKAKDPTQQANPVVDPTSRAARRRDASKM